MHVVFHAGAHMTDEDRLIRCLGANSDILAEAGTFAPPPSSYRKLIRDTLQEAQHGGLSSEVREVLLDSFLEDDSADRIVLSNPGFFGTPKMAASSGVFYGAADQRLRTLDRIFHKDQLELFLAIRNPATFLPAIFQHTPFKTFPEFLRGSDPAGFRWSEMIARIRTACPDLPITVWCNEDTPLIWAEVVRELAGLDPTRRFKGEFTLLSEIMTQAGMKRFQTYLKSHPDMSETQKRRVIAAFLDKFADEEAIEEELDIPGWTEEFIQHLSDIYDDDVLEIQRIPGVTLITP